MGGIIGGLIGGIGSVAAANKQASAQRYAADQARQTALTGYNYLTTGAGSGYANQLMNTGQEANSAQSALLGLGGNTPQATGAFNKYLGSTGYLFQLGQGQNAVNSNAAAAGMLNSGGTLKSLQQYGQGLAGNYFNTYLGQLGGLSGAGQQTLNTIGSAGTNGGAAGAGVVGANLGNAANAAASGIQSGFNSLGQAVGTLYNQRNVTSTKGS
jgi:hypothetical protein